MKGVYYIIAEDGIVSLMEYKEHYDTQKTETDNNNNDYFRQIFEVRWNGMMDNNQRNRSMTRTTMDYWTRMKWRTYWQSDSSFGPKRLSHKYLITLMLTTMADWVWQVGGGRKNVIIHVLEYIRFDAQFPFEETESFRDYNKQPPKQEQDDAAAVMNKETVKTVSAYIEYNNAVILQNMVEPQQFESAFV